MKKLVRGICLGAILSGCYWLGVAIGQHSGKAEGYLEGKDDACREILEKLTSDYRDFIKEGVTDIGVILRAVPKAAIEVAGWDVDYDKDIVGEA